MTEVVLVEDSEEVAGEAAKKLNELLASQFGGEVLLLLSGGSSLALLPLIRPEFLGPHLTIAVSDERASADPAESNFAQVMATSFYKTAQERGCEFIDTRLREGETADALATRFEIALKVWRASAKDGMVLMTQGIGPDGHTCGMMPYPKDKKAFEELFEDPKRWVTGYDAKGKSPYPLRVTITMPFLRKEVLASVLYATGKEKKGALTRALSKEGELHKTPSWIIHEMKSVTVFTDQKV